MKPRLVFTKSGNGAMGASDGVLFLRILLIGKLKSARQGRIVGADRKRAAAD
jgi:hypothetical protein